VQMHHSHAEAARGKEFEVALHASECRLSAAENDGVRDYVALVDEIGLNGKTRKLGAADCNVVLRFAF